MFDIFKPKISGTVTIYKRVNLPEINAGFWKPILKDARNTIMPQAKEITAKRLIQHPTSLIDKFRILNAGNLVLEKDVSATSILEPQRVQFDCEILAEDFQGFFDTVQLVASAIGPFSEITNLVMDKDITEPLLLSWKIKIL